MSLMNLIQKQKQPIPQVDINILYDREKKNKLWLLMSACILPGRINNYKIEAFLMFSCIYNVNKIKYITLLIR